MKYLFVIILTFFTYKTYAQYSEQFDDPYLKVGAPGYEEYVESYHYFEIKDYNNYIKKTKKAIEKGNVASAFHYSLFLLGGIEGFLKPDTALAIKMLSEESRMGYPPAQHSYGLLLFYGHGVHQNLKWAVDYIDSSAKQGYLPAKGMMSLMLLHGSGVKRDINKAIQLMEDCAKNGDIESQTRLGQLYYEGFDGIKADTTKAMYWLKKASENGSWSASNNLAYMYAKGMGAEKDFVKAHQLLGIARNQVFNNKEAMAQLLDSEGEFYLMEGKEQDAIIVWEKIKKEYNEFIDKFYSESGNVFVRTMFDKVLSKNDGVALAEKKDRIDNIISDVDEKIPELSIVGKPTFVVLIANENYNEVGKVPFAIHDGETFRNYCLKTLGIPQSNIHFTADATLNNIKREMNWLSQVMEVYNGEANIIFYYAGHGIPNESNGSAYLLPVDGVGNDVTTGYSLDKLYADLGSKPAKSVIVLLDACFSGARRDGGMLASARGVAIKAKQNAPKGNMVVLSAAQGDETAYPYKDKGHGLFTYYLLKKLQESKGNVTLGELADYVTAEVKKQSVVVNGKMQTPLASPSNNATDWRNWKLR